jgi:serine/threonine protein kinase
LFRYTALPRAAVVLWSELTFFPYRVVVKVVRQESKSELDNELATLSKLQGKNELLGRLSRLAHHFADAPAGVLYLEPVGSRLALTRADHASIENEEGAAVRATPQILAFVVITLRLLHEAQVVHRDVRPNNMLFDHSRKLVRCLSLCMSR